MENITRISDLPEQNNVYNPNISVQMSQNGGGMRNGNSNNDTANYVPINIHPNPYGISDKNPIMPHPQQPDAPQTQRQYFSDEQIQQMQNQRLPSRDIPIDKTTHMQDEQIKPNYIPKVRFEDDYVRNHEDMTEKNLRDYEEKNKKEKKMDILMNEIQTPLFIIVLFFFFQLPIVNMFFKKFSFLSIYNSDGNFNFNGLILKSIMFGGLYYIAMKLISTLSE